MKGISDKDLLKKFSFLRRPVECWTRVMGYFRPVSSFNEGKKSEFGHRKWFKENKIQSKRQRKNVPQKSK